SGASSHFAAATNISGKAAPMRQAGTDGNLAADALLGGGADEGEALLRRWSTGETPEEGRIIRLDRDREPGVRELSDEVEVALGKGRARLDHQKVEIRVLG